MNASFFDSATIRYYYDWLWHTSKDNLIQGLIQPDPLPDTPNSHWGISAVFRPTGEITAKLDEITLLLAEWAGNDQVLYTQENRHTTLHSIEYYRANVAPNDERVAQYAHILQAIVSRFVPIRMVYQGLTANQKGIIAQGWPLEDKLALLRQTFDEELQKHGFFLPGAKTRRSRRTAHARLIDFVQPLRNPAALVSFIEQHRETYLGETLATTIELVHYERTSSDVKMISLASI